MSNSERVLLRPLRSGTEAEALSQVGRMVERLSILDELAREDPTVADKYWEFVSRNYTERFGEETFAAIVSQALRWNVQIRHDLEVAI